MRKILLILSLIFLFASQVDATNIRSFWEKWLNYTSPTSFSINDCWDDAFTYKNYHNVTNWFVAKKLFWCLGWFDERRPDLLTNFTWDLIEGWDLTISFSDNKWLKDIVLYYNGLEYNSADIRRSGQCPTIPSRVLSSEDSFIRTMPYTEACLGVKKFVTDSNNWRITDFLIKLSIYAEGLHYVDLTAEDLAGIWGKYKKMWNRRKLDNAVSLLIDRSWPTLKNYELESDGEWTNEDPWMDSVIDDQLLWKHDFSQGNISCPANPDGGRYVVKRNITGCVWEGCTLETQQYECFLYCDNGYSKVGQTICRKEYKEVLCSNAETFWRKSVFKPKMFPADFNDPLEDVAELPEELVNLIEYPDRYADDWAIYYSELNPWGYTDPETGSYYGASNSATGKYFPELCLSCEYECPEGFHKDPYTLDEDINNYECVSNYKNIETEIPFLQKTVGLTPWTENYIATSNFATNTYSTHKLDVDYNSLTKTLRTYCDWNFTNEAWDCYNNVARYGDPVFVEGNVPAIDPLGWRMEIHDIDTCVLWETRLSECVFTNLDVTEAPLRATPVAYALEPENYRPYICEEDLNLSETIIDPNLTWENWDDIQTLPETFGTCTLPFVIEDCTL